MADESPVSKECRSRGCHESRSQHHDRCARHAPCARSGAFDPSLCEECHSRLAIVLSLPSDSRQTCPEWLQLKEQFIEAHALTVKHKRPELGWKSAEVSALFPDIGRVAPSPHSSKDSADASQGSAARMTAPGDTPTPSVSVSQGNTEALPAGADLGQLTAVLQQLCSHFLKPGCEKPGISKRPREEVLSYDSDGSLSSEAKRSRLDDEASSPQHGASPIDISVSEREALLTEALAKEVANLTSQGWIPAPTNWQFWEQTEGQFTAFESMEKEGKTSITPVPNIEIKAIESASGPPVILWRSKKVESNEESAKAFPRLKALGNSLASLSAILRKRSESVPKVELADVRSNNIAIQSTVPAEFPSCQLEELTKWWNSKSVYSAAQPPSQAKGAITTKFTVRWPQNSNADKMHQFLSASKITKADFPKSFPVKDMELVAADNSARQVAQSAWTASSTLDVLSNMLTAACSAATDDPNFDSGLVLQLTSQAVSGVAAILAPHTQRLVEDAIDKRLKLRSSVIPAKYKTVESKLLNTEPFDPKPCGAGEGFQTIVNDVPQPVQVTLPPQFYRNVNRSQSDQRGNSFNYSANKSRFNRDTHKDTESKGNFFRGNQKGKQFDKANNKTNYGKSYSKQGSGRDFGNSGTNKGGNYKNDSKGNASKYSKSQ